MKIPLVYSKIPNPTNCPLKQCIAFEKIDGTNIHFVWNSKNKYTHFGTRRDRYAYDSKNNGIHEWNDNHPQLGTAPGLIDPDMKLSEHLLKMYPLAKEAIIFTEFRGLNSFAGSHVAEAKELVIFDIMIDEKLLPPQEFVSNFKIFNIPKTVYQGKYTGQFVEDVRKGKYPVNEGVVVKGMVKDQIYMTKVKTNAYMEKLKLQFKDKWQDYWE